jgi:hypothetical protein
MLLEAILMLGVVRLGLSILSFRTLRRMLTYIADLGNHRPLPSQIEIDGILWALGAAGRAFPSIGTCLSQALAGYAWLGKKGYSTDLRIGVNREGGTKFSAHAWLQRGDAIVLGYIGREHDQFTPLPSMRGLEPL